MQITDMQSTTLTLTLIRHSESNRYKPIIANKETNPTIKHNLILSYTCSRLFTKKNDLLVSISEATKFLLSSSIPAVKSNLSTVCEKIQWVNLHTDGCCFGQAKSRRQNKTIANNDKHVSTNP